MTISASNIPHATKPTHSTIELTMTEVDENEIVRPSQAEIDKSYKPGSIKRVKLKNFLTYDAVEFWPGPRLV